MINLSINGKAVAYDGEPDMPLLWYLRDILHMTGTKYGCGEALCGACTVHVDGAAVRACVTPMSSVEDTDVTTIEGLAEKGHALFEAWEEVQVPQCGYCQPGQIMQAAALLAETPKPGDQDINDAMWGNLCRCGTYQRIRSAIHKAADKGAQG